MCGIISGKELKTINCEYDKALTGRTPEQGGSFKKLKESDPNHAIALNQVLNRNIVVGQHTLDGDTIYYLNPEKAHTEYVPKKPAKYIKIERPANVPIQDNVLTPIGWGQRGERKPVRGWQ